MQEALTILNKQLEEMEEMVEWSFKRYINTHERFKNVKANHKKSWDVWIHKSLTVQSSIKLVEDAQKVGK